MISIEDLNLIFYICVFNNNRGHHEKKRKKNKRKKHSEHHFATRFRPLTQKMMILVYRSTILIHFTMFAPATIILRGGGLERPAEMQASQAATSPRSPELGLGPERETELRSETKPWGERLNFLT
jgi:hypothetical protein